MSLKQYIQEYSSKAYTALSNILSFELGHTSEGPIYIHNIVIAVFLLLFTFRIYTYFQKSLNTLFVKHLSINHENCMMIVKTLSILIVSLYILMSLHVAGVPLYIFSFLGGAVALSLGLGIKDLVSDFINGIIITVNKCIVKGDIIRMNSNYFLIDNIGIFNVTMKSISGLILTVPHHIFQKNIITNCNIKVELLRFEIDLFINNQTHNPALFDLLQKIFNDIVNECEADYLIPSLLKNDAEQRHYHLKYNIKIQSLEDIENKYQIAIAIIANTLNANQIPFHLEVVKPSSALSNIK